MMRFRLIKKAACLGSKAAFKAYFSRYNFLRGNHRYSSLDTIPSPIVFYQNLFHGLKIHKQWAMVLCCFHDEKRPSLSLHLQTGAFKCFACGKSGKDVIDFYRQLHDVDFKTAVKALSAWRFHHD